MCRWGRFMFNHHIGRVKATPTLSAGIGTCPLLSAPHEGYGVRAAFRTAVSKYSTYKVILPFRTRTSLMYVWSYDLPLKVMTACPLCVTITPCRSASPLYTKSKYVRPPSTARSGPIAASSVAKSVIRRPRNGNSMTPSSANRLQIAAVSPV